MMATEAQKREAWDAVAGTLGIYTLTTSPRDPALRFGFVCALNAIVDRDRRAAMAPIIAFSEAFRVYAAALRRAGEGFAASAARLERARAAVPPA